MSAEEMMGEIGGGKRTAIVVAAVLVVLGDHRRGVHGVQGQARRAERGRPGAGAGRDAADPAARAAAAGPAPPQRRQPLRLLRRRLPHPPPLRQTTIRPPKAALTGRGEEARRQKSQGQEAPLTGAAGRVARARSAASEAERRQRSSAASQPAASDSEETVDGGGDGPATWSTLPRASRIVARGSADAELAVARGDAGLNLVGVVALVGAARGAAAGSRDRHRHVEEQRQIGRPQVAREAGHPVALRLLRPGRRARRAGSGRRRRPRPPASAGSISRVRWSRRSAAKSSAIASPSTGAPSGQLVAAEQDLAQQAADRAPGSARAWRAPAARARRGDVRRGPSCVVVPDPSIPSSTMNRGGVMSALE